MRLTFTASLPKSVADYGNYVVRAVSPDGEVKTFAGTGWCMRGYAASRTSPAARSWTASWRTPSLAGPSAWCMTGTATCLSPSTASIGFGSSRSSCQTSKSRVSHARRTSHFLRCGVRRTSSEREKQPLAREAVLFSVCLARPSSPCYNLIRTTPVTRSPPAGLAAASGTPTPREVPRDH